MSGHDQPKRPVTVLRNPHQEQRVEEDDQSAEVRRLRAELKRVTEERDILKKAAAYFAKECG